MQVRDHHDWTSEAYVDEWVRRQRAEDARRAERFQLMCDLFPFATDATAVILDVGAGYGPVSQFILERYPHVTCVAQDGSEPMLQRARDLLAGYGRRVRMHQSDLFDENWLPEQYRPFDAAVSSSCLHNLRDFSRISAIYADIRAHLKPGGVWLNLDLINAPTPVLQERYSSVAEARRQRERTGQGGGSSMVRSPERSSAAVATAAFPAGLDQHLHALRAAGFKEVDCFWKDLRRSLVGGYV